MHQLVNFKGYCFNAENIVTVKLNKPEVTDIFEYKQVTWFRKKPMIVGVCNYTVEEFQKLEEWSFDQETKTFWSKPSVSIRTVNDRVYEKFYESEEAARKDYDWIIDCLLK